MRDIVRSALAEIREPRFFASERGYQGELLANVRQRLERLTGSKGYPIIEQEYQKRLKDHGLRIRPDLIIHCPFESGGFSSRREGNFAVIELKLRASRQGSFAVFGKLEAMCRILDYPTGIFINIDSDETFLQEYQGDLKERLVSFAVHLSEYQVIIRETHATNLSLNPTS